MSTILTKTSVGHLTDNLYLCMYSNLYQPLEDAAMALEKELATRSSQDPKVFEIRALIESLRSAIADLASPS